LTTVAAYHTGAAENDATLVSDLSVAARAFWNDTDPATPYQEFDLDHTYPWGLRLGISSFYDIW
jgi:hypothetical protein